MRELLDKNLANVKSETDLFGNRVEKLSMKDRIGFLPISIWQPDWSVVKQLKTVIGDNAETRGGSSYGFQDSQSIYNPHLAQMILSAYCPPKAKIYDPFAGGGTRGFIAVSMGHEYAGREIRQNEVDMIHKQMEALDKRFTLYCGDARLDPPIENYYDFCYTCPPYYDLEVYSNMPDDLSNAGSYDTFLDGIRRTLLSTYKALKSDSMAVWTVGNFRDSKGQLIHFSGDTIRIAKEIGFKLHDEIIFWGASGNAVQRCGQFEANRKSVRVHEYLLVFKKP